MPGTPKAATPPLSPQLVPQGPSQLLTALLVRLSDATNRALIDQAAIDFAFLNSKAARKRLTRVCICLQFCSPDNLTNSRFSFSVKSPRIGQTSYHIIQDWWLLFTNICQMLGMILWQS